MRLLPYLDHLQNPPPAGTFVEVRLQQNPAIVIHQVAQSGVQVLPSPIDPRWRMKTRILAVIPASQWHMERAKAGLAILMPER